MFCSKCGATMPDIAVACPQCGAAVASAPPLPAPATAAAPAPGRVAPAQWQPAPPARPYLGQQETDGKAVGSLILGILAILCLGLFTGIPAVILGHLSRKSIRESLGRLRGEGMALAGLIMGYISIAVVPIILAIAIPSVLRARILANEAAAATTVRTFNTDQRLYANKYPSVGYARDLATLGMGTAMHCSEAEGTSEHACLIDRPLGSPNCTSGSWCVKSGYQFEVTAACGSDGVCSDYVAIATPVQPGTSGRRNFCSTSDAIIRAQPEGSAALPGTTAECQSWPPL